MQSRFCFMTLDSLQSESPQHPVLCGVEFVAGGGDAPAAHVLPASDREFVEERDGVSALDGREQGAVGGRQLLIAAPSLSRVFDNVGVVPDVPVGVARIDAPEVCEQRD